MKKNIAIALTAIMLTVLPVNAGAEGENASDENQAVQMLSDASSETQQSKNSAGEPDAQEKQTPEQDGAAQENQSHDQTAPSQEEQTPEQTVQQQHSPAQESFFSASPVSSEVNITVVMEERMAVTDSAAVFELYSAGDELLGRREEWVGGITAQLDMHFDVPEYHTGEKFKLRLVSGLTSLTYYTDKIYPGGEFELGTYCYTDEEGNAVIGNSFSLSGEPEFEKAIVLYIDDKLQSFSPGVRLIDGTAMAPAELLCGALKIKYRYDWEYNSAVCSAGDEYVFFNRDTAYATAFGNDFYAPHESLFIDDTFYIPVRSLADCFECGIDVYDQYDHIDICLGASQKVRDYFNSMPVNRYGISSRTKNLIWVSKSEYMVRVYEGSQYNWELINSFPCGIGAYGTPTVTGQFEYIERISSWNYANYYVGPVLRFYNGYAIHSTLLYYNGSEYDGTVRAHISHGCVRCHPWDINWLDKTVSIGTKIYITE